LTDVIAAIGALTDQIAATSHVGRSNRLLRRRERLFEAIDAHADRLDLLRQLLDHAQPSLRIAAAWHCGWRRVLLEESARVATALAATSGDNGELARDWLECQAAMAFGFPPSSANKPILAYAPTPLGLASETAMAMIAEAISMPRAGDISRLLRRAIRLWPRAHCGDFRASCFGGLPALPPGHAWPTLEEEPLLFLSQINCADLHASIGHNPFPERGLLQFYGDEDEVTGRGPFGASAVLYFPEVDALEPASPPVEEFEELPRCGLDFYETAELPALSSGGIASLGLSAAEQAAYDALRKKLTALAAPGDFPDRQSKLLGWPDLIQCDLGEDYGAPDEDDVLLHQIGWYHDGHSHQFWGPGGLVYFTIDREALVEGRFQIAEMEMQCT
jgi:uncharacterized protein YwqG